MYPILLAALLAAPLPTVPRPPTHAFTVERRVLNEPPRPPLALTLYRPAPRTPGERFPVLLELLPYRKDDSFARRDHSHHAYFARRGYLSVRADVRGTGSSGGPVPAREYSEPELDDAVHLIGALARSPGANGRVGMWGISWGGFNAIQTAMRQPPALGAILAVDAADDLYRDDVRYLDGIFHMDAYQLEIDHENGLPRSPGYAIDARFVAERFNQRPWILRYLARQRDGVFWSAHSLRGQYHRMRTPAFLIGGLQDLYRDSIPRMLEHVRAPVKGWIGPWNHDFPDEGVPGPNVDWRAAALAWWDRWLAGKQNGAEAWPPLTVFVRHGHAPGPEVTTVPGAWRSMASPEDSVTDRTWFTKGATAPDPSLRLELVDRAPPPRRHPLHYLPDNGRAAEDWWGDSPRDMQEDDRLLPCADSAPLTHPLTIIGHPRVHVRYRPRARLAHLIVRLEDVAPDGRVTLITGGARNGFSLRPGFHGPPPANADVSLELPMHFTTWTFRPGHRIRLIVTHAQFPMLWPTPERTTSDLAIGAGGTRLTLPVAGPATFSPPRFPPPETLDELPDSEDLQDSTGMIKTHGRDPGTHHPWFRMQTDYGYRLGARRYRIHEELTYRTNPHEPADSRADGLMVTTITGLPAGPFTLTTRTSVRSDAKYFHVDIRRELTRGGRVPLTRRWIESVPRDGH